MTVETTYTPDGLVATLTAKNPATGDQTTRYLYGTTRAPSDFNTVARSDLRVAGWRGSAGCDACPHRELKAFLQICRLGRPSDGQTPVCRL